MIGETGLDDVNVVVGREAAHEVSTREEGDLVLVKQVEQDLPWETWQALPSQVFSGILTWWLGLVAVLFRISFEPNWLGKRHTVRPLGLASQRNLAPTLKG